ncbi:MAG: TIM barrel protein, partial [Oscillospiraceae bacterium]
RALATHTIGQCVGDAPDPRLNNFAPPALADKPDEIRAWGIATMKKAAIVAKKLDVHVITGFTGSPIWKYLYSFPQTTEEMVENGFDEIVRLWSPILDEFKKNDVRFALEVHPGEIAFDYYSTKKLLEKFADRPEFGINFDPSHLIWQGVSPHLFLSDFRDRIYHVHMKDAAVTL